MEYIRIVNVGTGVINTVKKDRGIQLIHSGDYQEVPVEEKPVRKRRTKAEIEADKEG